MTIFKILRKIMGVTAIAVAVWMQSPSISAHTIVDAEYYVDTPGNGSHVLPCDGIFDEEIEHFKFPLPTTLPIGPHTLFFRLMDTNNNWGIFRRREFRVEEANPNKIITAAEYFIDNDPGIGHGIPLLPFDSTYDQPFEVAFYDSVAASNVPGSHRVYVRFRDNQFHQYGINTFSGWGPVRSETLVVKPDVAVQEIDVLPEVFALSQNYPNPFNPVTVISYRLPKESWVTLRVFDMLGRLTATLVDKNQQSGCYQATWNGNELGSGIYFYQIKAGNFSDTKKMLLVK